MMRPRPMTTRWSAVWAISLIRCEERNTVRPSAASRRTRVRTHFTPSGSNPLTGSSRISVLGSPSRAAAKPSRCPMPREKEPTRASATLSSPVMPMTSLTRRSVMPWVAASARRCCRALRPVCMALASRSTPTSRSGAACAVQKMKGSTRIRWTPAGMEIRLRTPGTIRPRNTAVRPCLSNHSTERPTSSAPTSGNRSASEEIRSGKCTASRARRCWKSWTARRPDRPPGGRPDMGEPVTHLVDHRLPSPALRDQASAGNGTPVLAWQR